MRDGHCTFPGCARSAARCETHHVTPRLLGGTTEPGNLVLLCPEHHRAVHRHRLTARVEAGGVKWLGPDGAALEVGRPSTSRGER